MAKKSKYKKLAPQLIVTSRDWDGLMVRLIRKSNQPLLLIGDFLEATVYGRATLSVQLKSSAEKNETILKFIKKITQSSQNLGNRTLIMCNEDEDVESIIQFLKECGYPCLGYYNSSTENELVTIGEWKNNKMSSQILACTDARFSELKIQNVNCLIHYSMPTSWTRFTMRFSALARTYNNYVCQNFEQILLEPTSTSATLNENLAHSVILLDENNNLQLPRLVEFMRKHNQRIQEEILAVSKRVLVMREESRIANGSLLCPQLLEFGECDEARCDNRHELTRFDAINKSDGIPCNGEIRIHILKVFSPTYYAARVLQHKPPNTTKWLEVRRSSEALKFLVQLDVHYRNDNNLFLHWPPHVNDLCIYKYADNFRRARILEAPVLNQKSTNVVQSNLKVTLKLIDDGTVISFVKCNEIFVCHDKFADFPPQAIDIRLMNIVPFDNERIWDSKTTKQVQKWIMEDIKINYITQASINFSLANTIWVKNVVVMEKLTSIDAYCQIVHLKKSLIDKNFGLLYKGDRKHLHDLAQEYGLLNVSELEIENSDSDLDYQSCRNDSTNLIKFSSNDEVTNSSMESAENEKITKMEQNSVESKNEVIAAIQHDKTSTFKIDMNSENNWDDLLDKGEHHEEIDVPLTANSWEEQLKSLNFDPSTQIKIALPNKKETWSQLPIKELVKVEIGDEGENGNWENIFLQIVDKNSMSLFDDLKTLIVQHINSIKSSGKNQREVDIKPLSNCIVKYSNLYLRAKIHGVYGESEDQRLYRIFLCDYACFIHAKRDDLYNDFLYETTDEIVTFTPYQAIHCTLAGIKWDSFTKRYQVTKDHLYACAVIERNLEEKSTLNLSNLPIHSYKILLYECEKENEFIAAKLFNKSLLENGITVCDEETKKFLDYEIAVDNKLNSSNEHKTEEIVNKDAVFTYEQLVNFISDDCVIELGDMVKDIKESEVCSTNSKAIELVGNGKNNQTADTNKIDKIKETDEVSRRNIKSYRIVDNKVINQKLKLPISDSEIEEQGNCTSNSNSVKSSISLSSSESSSCLEPRPLLKALHKRPLTTWYESDCMIFLSIYAPDIKDYILEVTSKTILFATQIQDEQSVLILNLLGSIDPQYVSHEIKGLNVFIRLKKNIYEKWPRLLEESTRYSWLKYNFNAFDSTEMEYIMPQQSLHTILDVLRFNGEQSDNYNSDDDSERELYQTYNPIQNNDDDLDPFS